jgi:hypothetical protein
MWTILLETQFEGDRAMSETPNLPVNQLNDIISGTLDIRCPDCGQEFPQEGFHIAVFLYGIFFLVGKEHGYAGITCPNCLNTFFWKDTKNNIVNIKKTSLIIIGSWQVFPEFTYFSPFHQNPKDYNKFKMFDISYWSVRDINNVILRLIDYLKNNPYLNEEYLCSLVLDDLEIESLMGDNLNVIWFREKEIERLVAIENKKKIKIFPRYYCKNELIEKIERFCWKNYLCRQYLENSILEQNNTLEKMAQIADYHGCPVEELCEENEVSSSTYLTEELLSDYNKNMELDFSLTSDFMEILLDDFGLKYAGPLKDIYTFLYTTKFPFINKKSPISLQNFEFDINSLNITVERVSNIIKNIAPYFSKENTQIHLRQASSEFINDYLEISRNLPFSIADVWLLRERYLKEVYQTVKREAVFEEKFVFCQEGGSWRLSFKGKSTGGYTGDGFKYLHFIIQNKYEPVSVQKLDKLDGILIKDQEDGHLKREEEDYVPDINPSIAAGSGSNRHHADEKKEKAGKKGRLDVRSKITPESIAQLEAHKAQLVKDIQKAKSEGDNVIYEELENEFNWVEEYLEENSKIMKNGDIVFKKDPHENRKEFKQIGDKIRIAIVRALNKIKEYDYEAWTHFEKSLDRKGGWCYNPQDNIDWFLGR